MRITILGLPGSGKSTLARNISKKLSIPYIQLDRFWLEAGGGHNSKSTADPERAHENVRTKALEAIQAESWVSDGVYSKVQPEIAERADIIVFLDISLLERLINHAARTMHRKDRHGEMSFFSDLQFFKEIIARDMRKKTKIRKFVEGHPEKSIILRNRKEIGRYLATLN